MSWAGALTAFHSNLTTAAAAVTPAIPLVRSGEPDELNTDTIAYWVTSSRDSHTGGPTLDLILRERGVQVTCWLRGSVRSGATDATLELRAAALEEAILAALWADAGLGGNALGIQIETITWGWDNLAGQLARTLSFVAWVDLPAMATIAL